MFSSLYGKLCFHWCSSHKAIKIKWLLQLVSSQYVQLNCSLEAYCVRKVDQILRSPTIVANLMLSLFVILFYILNKSRRKGSRLAQSLFFFYAKSHQSFKISPVRLIKLMTRTWAMGFTFWSAKRKSQHKKSFSLSFILSSIMGCRAQLISEEFFCLRGRKTRTIKFWPTIMLKLKSKLVYKKYN